MGKLLRSVALLAGGIAASFSAGHAEAPVERRQSLESIAAQSVWRSPSAYEHSNVVLEIPLSDHPLHREEANSIKKDAPIYKALLKESIDGSICYLKQSNAGIPLVGAVMQPYFTDARGIIVYGAHSLQYGIPFIAGTEDDGKTLRWAGAYPPSTMQTKSAADLPEMQQAAFQDFLDHALPYCAQISEDSRNVDFTAPPAATFVASRRSNATQTLAYIVYDGIPGKVLKDGNALYVLMSGFNADVPSSVYAVNRRWYMTPYPFGDTIISGEHAAIDAKVDAFLDGIGQMLNVPHVLR